jgi:trehalose/maltose hydrolase-like predicted phosphorylase
VVKNVYTYRSATAPHAAENAKLYGGVGYHYPWESGTTGAEVSPDTCPPTNPRCHWNRYYVTAGVSYAIRLYYSMTRDRDYMMNTIYAGCDVSREAAKFLAEQATYNSSSGRYDMNGIYY